MKKFFTILLVITMVFSLAACGGTSNEPDNSSNAAASSAPTKPVTELESTESGMPETTESTAPSVTEPAASGDIIEIQIGATVLTATLADNSSAEAFAELLKTGDVTVDMHDYGNFEKVGSLLQSIVRNDEDITTEPGDIILYQGNQITIYYDTNTYNFTRLGKIDGVSQEELKSLLGDGDVSVTFRLPHEEPITSKVLVAYFSATGTTKKIAEFAADVASADLYEIVPTEPYTTDDLNYNVSDCRANIEMNDPSSRPEINGGIANMADYDIVFIGYPIWWGEAPRIVSTFIESYNFSGKTVVTFSTSGGSGHNDRSIKELASGANWVTGARMKSNSSRSDVAEWINGLGLDITVK